MTNAEKPKLLYKNYYPDSLIEAPSTFFGSATSNLQLGYVFNTPNYLERHKYGLVRVTDTAVHDFLAAIPLVNSWTFMQGVFDCPYPKDYNYFVKERGKDLKFYVSKVDRSRNDVILVGILVYDDCLDDQEFTFQYLLAFKSNTLRSVCEVSFHFSQVDHSFGHTTAVIGDNRFKTTTSNLDDDGDRDYRKL